MLGLYHLSFMWYLLSSVIILWGRDNGRKKIKSPNRCVECNENLQSLQAKVWGRRILCVKVVRSEHLVFQMRQWNRTVQWHDQLSPRLESERETTRVTIFLTMGYLVRTAERCSLMLCNALATALMKDDAPQRKGLECFLSIYNGDDFLNAVKLHILLCPLQRCHDHCK